MKREPRTPWRVLTTCRYGATQTIASPARLDDGTPFPTWAWLVCPWLTHVAAVAETAGECDVWTRRLSDDTRLSARMRRVDCEVRRLRREESGGVDACEQVGLAGQRDCTKVKCLHAHIAYALAGLDDPIGCELLARHGKACGDRRCVR
ncbi:MAG: DUF501 domain-containing protein [Actinomycetes bacterium]|nr:DUF501 domain-containing protein [Actinomycetes bacterium]